MTDAGPTAAEMGLTQKDITPKTPEVPENEFHKQIADRYNEWQRGIVARGEDPKKAIFRPVEYTGDWSKVLAADYLLHRLSIIGVVGEEVKTAGDIGETLKEYREKIATPERIAMAQEAYKDFNAHVKRLGLSAGEFDPNRMVFVSRQRIEEISGESDTLAYSLDGGFGEIIVPHDSADLNKDPNQTFDVIVHELGHQVRDKLGLDRDRVTWIEEGLIQRNAKEIEIKEDKVSERTNEIYGIEVSVMEQLSLVLGDTNLFGKSQTEIQRLINERYAIAGGTGEPLDDLNYDIRSYKSRRASFVVRLELESNVTDEEVEKMNESLRIAKQMMNQKWGFNLK